VKANAKNKYKKFHMSAVPYQRPSYKYKRIELPYELNDLE
jgi:hypothetical protein